MSTRDDHLRHFANYLNITAGGLGVAAAATAPISAVASGKFGAWALSEFVVALLVISLLLLHGVGQLVLKGVKSCSRSC